MSFRYIAKTVREFQGGLVRDHYHDLRYTSLILFNEIVSGIRRGSFKDLYRKVLDTSKVIEETTLMEEQMRDDINTYKTELIHWHHNDDGKMCYKIPRMAKTFEAFRDKKSCKAKDYAVEIVTKMYRLDQEDRVAVKKEIEESKARIQSSS